MHLLKGLVIFCILYGANSQNSLKNTELYNGVFINPDRIYFEDERSSLFPRSAVLPRATYRPDITRQEKSGGPLLTADVKVETAKVNRERSDGFKNQNKFFLQNQGGNIEAVPFQNKPQTNDNFRYIPDAVTNFGVNLFKQVNVLQEGNTVISPYSITMLLALLQQGAKETTLEQISTALQLSSANSAEYYRKITDEVEKRNSRNILKVANNIFVADSFNINYGFQAIATSNFKSDMTLLSFVRPDLAAQTINNWIASKTDNQITKLLSSDSISENTQMVLVNAVYFKGLWQIPFRPQATLSRPFEVSRGVTKSVDFMRTRRYFRTGVDSFTNAKVIILPFEYDEYSLMIILPSQLSDVNKEISILDVARLSSYHNFTAKDVELELPKFTVKADTDLAPVFTNLGIKNIFNQRSELYGLGTYRASSPQVSSALHSAVLSIDERGGSAAAATSFSVVALSYDDASVKFIANRPFIAVLWDGRASLPLFMAKIVDPMP